MKFIWLDLETTGLNPQKCGILEVAIGVADFKHPFEVKRVYHTLVDPGDHVHWEHGALLIHQKSGFHDEWMNAKAKLRAGSFDEMIPISMINDSGVEIAVRAETGDDKDWILAGSSVHFDHEFLKMHLSHFASFLSHRHYDVSALKLFCQSLGMPKLPRAEAHRAWDDIEESIEHALKCKAWLESP